MSEHDQIMEELDILKEQIVKLETIQKSQGEKMDNLQKTLDRFFEDFRDDRRARGEMDITLQDVAVKTNATREDLADNQKDTQRLVKDEIHKVIEPIREKMDKIVESKTAVMHVIKDERKHFKLKFWKGDDIK